MIALLLAMLPLNEPVERPDVGPNVVFVFIDDMGFGDLGCFGGAAETPHIDRLAAEGLKFTQFCVNSPICSPSRVAVSTGQYPQRWRITSYLDSRRSNERRGMAQWLDPAAPMLARMLREAGYATGHFGKWHMGGQRDVGDAPGIDAYGFDRSLTNFEGLGTRVLPLLDAFDGKPARPHALGSDKLGRGPIRWQRRDLVTADFVAAAVDFIDDATEAGQPFYLNLWPDDVHTPLFPPAAARGDGSKTARYHGVLETMDRQLGVLFDRIDRDETLRHNTLVLLCSDNGPEQGAGVTGGLRGHKTMLYEGGVRSPLIVWAPGLMDAQAVGTANGQSVFSGIDLPPTLLAVCGVDSDADFDGEALPDVLLGRSQASRSQPIFFRRPPDRDRFYGVADLPDLAVRDGRWKLLCEFDGSQTELYDLAADPGETTNLAADNPDVVKRLRSRLLEWNESLGR